MSISRLASDSVTVVKIKKTAAQLTLAAVVVGVCSCSSSSNSGAFPSVALPQQSPVQETVRSTNDRAFAPGDQLELYVEEDTSFNGSYVVRPEGYVLIPKLGRVPINGLSRDGAEKRMKEYLQRTQLTTATVFVELIQKQKVDSAQGLSPAIAAQPKVRIFITGKVSKPGQHLVPVTGNRNPGVYEALLMTGGVSNFGNLSKVEILRMDASGKRHKKLVDVRKIQAGEIPDVEIGDGDIINVPEKVFGF